VSRALQCSIHEVGQQWEVSHPGQGIVYRVTLGEGGHLECSCGLGILSGLPCAHELCVQRKYPSALLRFRQRWYSKYSEKMKERLKSELGTMTLHYQSFQGGGENNQVRTRKRGPRRLKDISAFPPQSDVPP